MIKKPRGEYTRKSDRSEGINLNWQLHKNIGLGGGVTKDKKAHDSEKEINRIQEVLQFTCGCDAA